MAAEEPPHPSQEPSSGAPPTVDGSREIGPYKLLTVLGEGGMGTVYLAEQTEPMRRRVALKVLRVGVDTEEALARFESERQALAVMDHPSIAKIFESGVTPTGRPYFAMEVVHGTPITEYADTHRLSTAARVRLFIEVCAAVQHAHQKGVIHRDLTPSNVLVVAGDAEPGVRVIDFGIAKAAGMGFTHRTLVTQAGQMVGTPAYMSPEQAENSGLDVDTRTDIYSLGVMLYELIVGTLPFDLTARPAAAVPYALREEDVPRPSTKLTSLGPTLANIARHRNTTPEVLHRELKGDLDWIILRAMEKDRTRRYETANGLALDLQRHLNNEPVLARPPSVGYRAAKFVRRHRSGVFAAAVATLAVLGGAAAAWVGFVHARAEQQRAEQAAATSAQITDFLVNLFSVSDPGEARGNTITAREVLDRGSARIREELVDQPTVQARLLVVMGNVYRGLGLFGEAASLLEEAVRIGERDPVGDRAETAHALERLGVTYSRLGRTEDAARTFERARAVAREAGPAGTLRFAEASRGLGGVYLMEGRYAEAAPLVLEAQEIQERELGLEHGEVASTLNTLGAIHFRTRDHARAEEYFSRALEIWERDLGANHVLVAQSHSNLGAVRFQEGNYEAAEEAYARSLAIQEQNLGPDHPSLATVLTNLGEAAWRLGRLDEAEAYLERALHLKRENFGPAHPELSSALRYLGNVNRDAGRHAEAESMYRDALAFYEGSVDELDFRIQEVLEDLTELLNRMGRSQEATELEQRITQLEERRAGR
ncbi:MAG: serine/threonine-protein kinase [Gemmatimonadota bacterium]